MSSLREIDYKLFYTPSDDLLNGFYIPSLKAARRYDRSAGFFSSSALAAAAAGVAHLIQNNGQMRLLVGAELSPADVKAIERGEDLRGRLAEPLLARFPHPYDAILRQRLEVLAWMVATGSLEIKVVLPVGPDGRVIPGPEAEDYYHTKKGIFLDDVGDRVAFVGSVNETAQGWKRNFEEFAVYVSWETDRERAALDQVQLSFEKLWEGQDPDWKAVAIPEAVRDHLLRFAPEKPPTEDPAAAHERERKAREEQRGLRAQGTAKERVVFQFLRDAPRLPQSEDLATATSAVTPWPHQVSAARAVVDRYPDGSLLCDEVGLGKTIEAGLIVRTLLLSGNVRRCLILTPKSILRQWQEELYEKFGLDVPRYDGGRLWNAHGELICEAGRTIWDECDVLLASSQLAKRRERLPDLEAARPWDLVVVDEAHHARRKDFRELRYRPNRLLVLLETLRNKISGLILVTATPMQVHPVELWDLLVQLGMGGAWASDESGFLRYFRELRKSYEGVDWDFVLDMVNDQLQGGMELDRHLAEQARRELGTVAWRQIEELPGKPAPRARLLRDIPPQARTYLYELARRHTPLSPYLFRNTRTLLRKYVERGLLKDRVPTRKPRMERVPFTAEEERLYLRVDEYITNFYHKYESERRGLGFVMTVYRRRLTSSFYALRRSLERRLEFLEGRLEPTEVFDDDDLEQDELSLDVSDEVLGEADRARFQEELEYVRGFIQDLRSLSVADSKLEHLKREIDETFHRRDKALVFTQYTDTMDFLREHLKEVYGTQVACYSGRGGELFNGLAWVRSTKEEVKNRFLRGEVRILVCTEAASEGLNLQTCGVLINYDMPWNPMRVEQRIGRIDRIGQVYDEVWITNYFYEGTIEDLIYQRLKDRIRWFEEVVGDLQPILAEIGEVTRDLAMMPEERRRIELDRRIKDIRAKIERAKAEALNLEAYSGEGLSALDLRSPVTMQELENWLTRESQVTNWMFTPSHRVEGAYILELEDEQHEVTFDAGRFDEHPDTLRFMTYGEDVFQRLLETASPPAGDDFGSLIRCADEAYTQVAWFAAEADLARPIDSLDGLLRTYVSDHRPADGAIQQARLLYNEQAGRSEERLWRLRGLQRQRREHQILVRGKRLLMNAALVEIALGQSPGLFDNHVYPTLFEPGSVRGLRRHGYPWTALLELCYQDSTSPREEDPYFAEVSSLRAEELHDLFKELTEQAERQLEAWRTVREVGAMTRG